MEGKSVTVGVRMPEEMRDALVELAKADRRTVSQYAMLILRDHIEGQLRAKPPRPRAKGKRAE